MNRFSKKKSGGVALLFVLVVLVILGLMFRLMLKTRSEVSTATKAEIEQRALKLGLNEVIEGYRKALLSTLETRLADGLTTDMVLDLTDVPYAPGPNVQVQLECMYEYTSVGLTPQKSNQCTLNRKNLPKVFRLVLSLRVDDVIITSLVGLTVGRTTINNYSYVIGFQPAEIVALSGTFDGPVSINFKDGSDPNSIVALMNPVGQEFTVNGLFSTNVSWKNKIKKGNEIPGFENFQNGPINFRDGVNYGLDVPSPLGDIFTEFDSLKNSAGVIKGPVGDDVASSTIEFGDAADPCHVKITEQLTNGTIKVLRENQNLPDHSVVYLRGQETRVVMNTSDNVGHICVNASTIMAKKDILLGGSLVRGRPGGPTPEPTENHIAFVSLEGVAGKITADTYVNGTGDTFGSVEPSLIDPTKPSVQLEASFASVSPDDSSHGLSAQPAVYVDPALYAGVGAKDLGTISVVGAVIAGIHAGVNAVFQDGTFRGFKSVLAHPGAGFLSGGTPRGFLSSTSAQLSCVVSSIDYEMKNLDQLIAGN